MDMDGWIFRIHLQHVSHYLRKLNFFVHQQYIIAKLSLQLLLSEKLYLCSLFVRPCWVEPSLLLSSLSLESEIISTSLVILVKTGAQTETENWIKLLKYEQSRPFPKPSYRHWKSEGWQMGFPFPGEGANFNIREVKSIFWITASCKCGFGRQNTLLMKLSKCL